MWYFKRFKFLLYFIFNVFMYKFLYLRAFIYFSVRVQGSEYISVGRGTIVQRQGWLLALKIDHNNPELSIGKNCAIGDFCHITAVRKVIIEDDVLIANKVYISDNSHAYENVSVPIINQSILFKKEVIIGSGSWIGENVAIIGASIGKNAVVAANSVVTKDVPDYSIAAGIPARIIKKYDPETDTWKKI